MADDNQDVELSEPVLKKLSAIINSAITDQLKRYDKKQSERFASLEKKPEPTSKDEEGTKPKASKETGNAELDEMRKLIAKQDKALKDLQRRETAANEKARSATFNSDLQRKLKGKVAEDWLDIAVDKVSGKAKFNKEDIPEFEIDGISASTDEYLDHWLKDEGNKRFLPAPATPKGVLPGKQYVQPTQAEMQNIRPGSWEHMNVLGGEIADAFSATGTTLDEVLSKG